MTEEASAESVAGAEAYEATLVPALFEEWADPLARAAGIGPGDRVLDVACGTGVVARAVQLLVGDSGRVAGVDPDAGMRTVATRLAPGIDWQEGVASDLPFPDRSFDAVVSQFGMMFFHDRGRALREMLRVLDDDGRIAIAVWDAIERQPLYRIEVDILDRLAGPVAADALRAPFVLGDTNELEQIFLSSGVADLRIETRIGTGRFPSVRSLVGGDLRGWLPLMGVHLSEEKIEEILRAAETEMESFVTGEGLVFDSPAHIVSGRKASPRAGTP